ncbi:MAG: hypothetical protein CM15mV90_290 [uncultured marine virus]|nr:MAG: hypothetical protein CM15mV90_290 [uncultured marine virus]
MLRYIYKKMKFKTPSHSSPKMDVEVACVKIIPPVIVATVVYRPRVLGKPVLKRKQIKLTC